MLQLQRSCGARSNITTDETSHGEEDGTIVSAAKIKPSKTAQAKANQKEHMSTQTPTSNI